MCKSAKAGKPTVLSMTQGCDSFQDHVAGPLHSPLIVLFEQDGADQAFDGGFSLNPFGETGRLDHPFGGTVRLTACQGGPGCIAGSDDDARLPQLRWPPLPSRDHQSCCLALFPLPPEPAPCR
jgi:hypothetical protein